LEEIESNSEDIRSGSDDEEQQKRMKDLKNTVSMAKDDVPVVVRQGRGPRSRYCSGADRDVYKQDGEHSPAETQPPNDGGDANLGEVDIGPDDDQVDNEGARA
jgi:hypothetical protein